MRLLLTSIFCILLSYLLYQRETLIATFQTFASEYNFSITAKSPHQETMAAPSSTFAGLPVVPAEDPSLTKDASASVPRAIRMSFLAIEQEEGMGARVRRSIGTPKLRNFSPFLMLDHFNSTEGGFPDHPHRGQVCIPLHQQTLSGAKLTT
jgi:hypothetical protein